MDKVRGIHSRFSPVVAAQVTRMPCESVHKMKQNVNEDPLNLQRRSLNSNISEKGRFPDILLHIWSLLRVMQLRIYTHSRVCVCSSVWVPMCVCARRKFLCDRSLLFDCCKCTDPFLLSVRVCVPKCECMRYIDAVRVRAREGDAWAWQSMLMTLMCERGSEREESSANR